jgi:hypothetical protein
MWEICLLPLAILKLSNKMASYIAVIKRFFKSWVASQVATERQYRREFYIHVLQSRDTVYRLVKQFEENRNWYDKRSRGRNSSASVCTREVVDAARKAVTRFQRKGMKRLPQPIRAQP